jgi:Zn-dependent peptidase ImmA (M78 family)
MAFKRGFKTQCENMATQVRRELGLKSYEPLSTDRLATYLDVRLISPAHVIGLSPSALRILQGSGADEWSAVTLTEAEREIVIYNPTHSIARQASDVMHELAHLMLGHKPSTFMLAPGNGWAIRSYDSDQEDEAGWLSGCLLLPRPALLSFEGRPDTEVCAEYGVSLALLRFRRNASGVATQMRRKRSPSRVARTG